ncbi:hypothetical protein PhCBS80983_g02560 [Powellomyces hirtus]|uniref:ATP-dependent RNA helicase n=1 Tax=Powellomyces hirtus TaxID=109895 RepID=A0A507E593_9FUNG|nr:hypothetical protein PhCBS80983_g02560 [Powellomyces hirtus]
MAVLPRLLQTRYSSAAIPPGDLCVSAPTGSGKTLAYALPIVETLIGRMVPRVRALIVLPTRDLAAQVKVTFDMLLRGTDVRAILITGQTAFATEQAQLVANEEWDVVTEENGSSRVDIVIATPGRLIDHLKGTKGFTLRHLRFLVIDEADRLLNQSYQDWLIHVLQAAEQPARDAPPVAVPTDLQSSHWARLGFKVNDLHLPVHSVQTHRHALSSTAVATSTSTDTTQLATPHFIHHYTPLQKLLFSATLTRNPAKIASLHLYNPTYVAVAASQDTTTETASATTTPVTDEARYVAPSTLEERMIVCDSAGDKPLTLLHVLYNLNAKGVLVFTKSVEAAHRLAALIQIFDRARRKEKEADTDSSSSSSDSDSDSNQPDTTPSTRTITSPAHAFSSDLPPSTRKRLLHSFQTGSTSALICSDVMARGMDLGSSVHHVINYDIPTRIKTYVHRIGRTARAGREGTAWSILEPREVRWFKGEIGKVEREGRKVRRIKVGMEETGNLVKGYSRALAELGGLVKGMEGKDRKEKVRKEVEAKGNSKTKEVDIESSSDSSSSSTSSSDDSDSSDSDTDSDSSATSTISSSSSSPSTSNPTHPSSTNDDNHHRDEPAYTATHTHTTITTPIMKANTTRLEDALQRVANLISPLQTQHQRMGAGEWWDEDA